MPPILTPVPTSRILVADADPGIRNELTLCLSGAGHVCLPAEIASALGEVRQFRPDVALVGLTHAEDGGAWVLRMLRAEPLVTTVAVTQPDLDLAAAAMRLGAVDCLPWPASAETVIEAVERAVEWDAASRGRRDGARRVDDDVTQGARRLLETVRRVDAGTVSRVLLALLESRAPEMYDHAVRVARSSVALAHALRLAPMEMRVIRDAALLHDIGKLALPPRLLANSGPLSDEEIAASRRHVVVARQVLEPVVPLAAAAAIVGSTCEQWDGEGYPLGLAGTAIPLGARIIAVTERYDVLTVGRAVGAPLGHDEAVHDLLAAAGTRFDPDVLHAWLVMGERVRCCS